MLIRFLEWKYSVEQSTICIKNTIEPVPCKKNKFSSSIYSDRFQRICGTYEQLDYWPNVFDDFYVRQIIDDRNSIIEILFRRRWSLYTTS